MRVTAAGPLATLAILAVVQAPGDARGEDAAERLLVGAQAFRAGRYAEALTLFEALRGSADAPADLAFYLGPTLYKLGRFEEALAVFVQAEGARDPLAELYLGQTYYQLHLYQKARGTFAALHAGGLGPRLAAAAERYVDRIDRLYAQPVAPTTIDAYLERGRALLGQGRVVVAAELLDEARLVEARGPLRHRRDEIEAALAATWNLRGRPRAVIDLLAGARSLDGERAVELGRAYLAIGDGASARAVLAPAARARGPWAERARELLGSAGP